MGGSNYWDYRDYRDTGTGTNWSTSPTDTSTYGGSWYWTSPYSTPVTYVPRRILVTHPEHWTEEQGLKYVELINIKTKTGWVVTLFIKGKVLITDPDVEKREMKDFVPLLRKRASASDLELIDAFYEENPC